MVTGLNHVSIAVPDLDAAARELKEKYGLHVGQPMVNAEQGVRLAYVELGAARIELIAPSRPDSPIAKFLERNPDGGIHHICYEVDDILAARDKLKAEGARVLGDGNPKIGAHGKPVLFLHPKDFCGTLVEIEQA
jgi:methylmalonyl-CoA/ethylmalonyl-CoA epimerase